MLIAVVSDFNEPLNRQINNKIKHTYDCIMSSYPSDRQYDVCLCFGKYPYLSKIKAKNKIFIVGEPACIISKYPSLKEYDAVVSFRNDIDGNIISKYTPFPWHYGLCKMTNKFLNFEDIKNSNLIKKNKCLVLRSSKNMCEGHVKRNAFINRCKDKLGNLLDIIEAPWDDKSILNQYRYHLAIENYVNDDYWTEKLSDAMLGLTLPFYYGAQNINKYFENGIVKIDMSDLSIDKMQNLILNNEWEKQQYFIESNKNDILYKYNFFNYMDGVIDGIL